MILGRPWIHDMGTIPSKLHGRLKFKFQGEVDTILGNLEPYELYNITNFEDMALIPPLFKIEPLDDPTLGANADK